MLFVPDFVIALTMPPVERPNSARVPGGHDLEFLDRFLRDGEGVVRALAAADAAEERLVVVGPVDADVGVDAALAGERELAALRVDLHRRREGDEVLEPPAVDGQVLDRRLVEGGRADAARSSPRSGDSLTTVTLRHPSDLHRGVG